MLFFRRSIPRNVNLWNFDAGIKQILDVRLQNVRFRSIDCLNTIVFDDESQSSGMFPCVFITDFGSILDRDTKSRHASINVDDIFATAEQVDDLDDL